MHAKKSARPAAALALPRAPARTPDARDSFFLKIAFPTFVFRDAMRCEHPTPIADLNPEAKENPRFRDSEAQKML